MYRFFPIRNRLTRALRPKPSLERAAIEIEVLQGEEVEEVRPPIVLPSQSAKATAGVAGHSSLADELEIARQSRRIHAPVIRYVLPDCLVHPGGVEYDGGYIAKTPLQIRPLLTGKVVERTQAFYAMSSVSHAFFGHWLQDACPTALLANPGEALCLDMRPDWTHTEEYVAACRFVPETSRLVHAERLTVVQDHGQGSSKRARYAELRHRFAEAFGPASPAGLNVYFRRGASGAVRLIANEAEVERALSAAGFETFDLEGATAGQIWRRLATAKTVVSIDGSHLNHLYFALSPDAFLLTLVQADRFTMTQLGYSTATNIRMGYVVIDPTEGGYSVSVSDLLATLDLA